MQRFSSLRWKLRLPAFEKIDWAKKAPGKVMGFACGSLGTGSHSVNEKGSEHGFCRSEHLLPTFVR
jgi:hypothetical protein